MTDQPEIPESLREQLSRAGKARARQFSREHQSKAGKAAWASRVRKAQAKAKEAGTWGRDDTTDQSTSTPKEQ